MSIKVTQYKNGNLDTKTSSALQSILSTLEKQANSVKEVTVFANFSIDAANTFKYGQLVTQGLVVCVNPDYKMSPEDMSWFHPNIGAGRSVFQLAAPLSQADLKAVHFDNNSSSVGEFLTSVADEFGSSEISHHLVVDSAPNVSSMYDKWLSDGLTAGEIQAQWKSQGQRQSTRLRKASVETVVNSAPTYSDTTNDILTDMTHLHFTNNVVKKSSAEVLMKSSALGGYRRYNLTSKTRRFYPATLGTSSKYYSWEQMSPSNITRIAETCSWSGKIPFNTQVMTPPSIKGTAVRMLEDNLGLTGLTSLDMRLTHFSSDAAIVDKMSPADILNLTPSQNVEFISAPIDSNHQVFQKLMANLVSIQESCPGFELLNPKFVKGGRLSLPLNVYQQLV